MEGVKFESRAGVRMKIMLLTTKYTSKTYFSYYTLYWCTIILCNALCYARFFINLCSMLRRIRSDNEVMNHGKRLRRINRQLVETEFIDVPTLPDQSEIQLNFPFRRIGNIPPKEIRIDTTRRYS